MNCKVLEVCTKIENIIKSNGSFDEVLAVMAELKKQAIDDITTLNFDTTGTTPDLIQAIAAEQMHDEDMMKQEWASLYYAAEKMGLKQDCYREKINSILGKEKFVAWLKSQSPQMTIQYVFLNYEIVSNPVVNYLNDTANKNEKYYIRDGYVTKKVGSFWWGCPLPCWLYELNEIEEDMTVERVLEFIKP